jgi:hypothetical protein
LCVAAEEDDCAKV